MKLLTVDTEEKRYNDCYLKVKNVGHEDSLLVELYSKSEGFIALLSNPGIRTTRRIALYYKLSWGNEIFNRK